MLRPGQAALDYISGKRVKYYNVFYLSLLVLAVNILLLHLSKENNFPELAYKTVLEKVLEEHYHEDTIRLNVASRYKQTPLINIV